MTVTTTELEYYKDIARDADAIAEAMFRELSRGRLGAFEQAMMPPLVSTIIAQRMSVKAMPKK